jgi:PPOX class probable F420-dependent enzyme
VASGSCKRLSELQAGVRAIVENARRAALASIGEDGNPHVVPVCFAIVGEEVVSAIDHKPKSGRELARVANVRARPNATLLFDRWDEDWTRLGWVMVAGSAHMAPPGAGADELAARYRQYQEQPPRGEVIVLRPEVIRWWFWE